MQILHTLILKLSKWVGRCALLSTSSIIFLGKWSEIYQRRTRHSQHNGKKSYSIRSGIHLQTLASNGSNLYTWLFLFEGPFKIKILRKHLWTPASCASLVTELVFTVIFYVFTALSKRMFLQFDFLHSRQTMQTTKLACCGRNAQCHESYWLFPPGLQVFGEK